MSSRITNKNKGMEDYPSSLFQDKQNKRQWLIVSLLALILLFVMTTRANAQSFYGFYGVVSNVGEQTLLAKGNQQINETVRSEIKHQTKTGVIQNAMAAEFSKMRKWEQQYNKYLKTATNFASSLKAATHIYDSGMKILLTLSKLRKAASNNPQGIVATLSMNNLYMETLLEFVSVGNLLKNAIAKGGKTNMLTGAERSKSLWELEDRLSSLSARLYQLYLSIRHYTMADVWYRATAGMVDRRKGELAEQSLSHWKRCAKEVAIYAK